jgi:hypothetical protein
MIFKLQAYFESCNDSLCGLNTIFLNINFTSFIIKKKDNKLEVFLFSQKASQKENKVLI